MPYITNGTDVEHVEVNAVKEHVSPAKEGKRVSEWDVLAFRHIFAGSSAQVLAPTDDGYSKSLERWSRAAEKPAGLSIQPTTNEEVALAVKHTADQGFHLAVKGGGHSTAGASSTDGGVLIDLTKMREVTVDVEAQQIHVSSLMTLRWITKLTLAKDPRRRTVG